MNNLLKQLATKIAEIKEVSISEEEMKSIETTMQTKSNEVEHTTNTGYGLELVPTNILSDMVISAIPQYATISNAFSVGFHGNNM